MHIDEAIKTLKKVQKIKGFELLKLQDKGYAVFTPPEFPGLTWSWNAYIYFNQNHVIGKAIRPLDEDDYYFCNAPPDEGAIPDYMSINLSIPCIDN